eukprot:355873-Chlamydomonas_euryale.AAC.1
MSRACCAELSFRLSSSVAYGCATCGWKWQAQAGQVVRRAGRGGEEAIPVFQYSKTIMVRNSHVRAGRNMHMQHPCAAAMHIETAANAATSKTSGCSTQTQHLAATPVCNSRPQQPGRHAWPQHPAATPCCNSPAATPNRNTRPQHLTATPGRNARPQHPAATPGCNTKPPHEAATPGRNARPQQPHALVFRVERLPDALERAECAQNKREVRGESERLVNRDREEVLADVGDGLVALCLAREVLDEEADRAAQRQLIARRADHAQVRQRAAWSE